MQKPSPFVFVAGAVLTLCAVVAVVVLSLRPSNAVDAINAGYYSVARELLEAEAKSGDATAQNTLGNLYYLGLGGPRNQTRAAHWYLQAALQNNVNAQINVARHYVLGLGIAKDSTRAFAWLFHARGNGAEVAEGHIKLLAGSVQITPTHVQRARTLYPSVESLRPKEGEGE